MYSEGLRDEGRKLSSNNPFRTPKVPQDPPSRAVSNGLSNSAFDDWVLRNKKLIDSDDENDFRVRPSFPTLSRTGSDTNVNYGSARYVYFDFQWFIFKLVCLFSPFFLSLALLSCHTDVIWPG